MSKTVLIPMAILTCFVTYGPAAADSSSASSIAGGNTPTTDKMPKDKQTDLTGGQQGVPDEYSTTPVRQGSLKEVTDSKWLNQPVTNKQGEKLGTIRKVLKDEKTQNIEYVFFEVADSRSARPLPWSQFQQNGDKLVLNSTKEELLPAVNRNEVKDMSPDLAMFMDEIEQKRAEPKPNVGPGDGRGTNRGPSSGAMGEDKAAGNLGDRGGPPGQAPGFKNEAGKKKE
jgi:PRC-barrel domain protein